MSGRRRRGRVEAEDAVDLFPFLSIMLCVVGVLAFVQVLMVMLARPKVQMAGPGENGSRGAYQIICVPEGVVLVPPSDELGALIDKLNGAEAERVRAIRDARRQLSLRPRSGVAIGSLARTMDDAAVLSFLRDVQIINTSARVAGAGYEEILLFGVRPGGGPVYHRFRTALERVDLGGIKSGLIPLSSEWSLPVTSRGDAP